MPLTQVHLTTSKQIVTKAFTNAATKAISENIAMMIECKSIKNVQSLIKVVLQLKCIYTPCASCETAGLV